NIIIDKAVNLIGIGRPVIDGGGKDNDEAAVFVCYLDNTASGRVQGFRITGGGTGQYGHGLQISNCSPEIFDNHITDNKHAGIGIHGMKKFTKQTKVHNNTIYGNAIGISNGLGASGQIYDNTIYDNKITGIGIRGLATPTVKRNNIYRNYIGIGVREEAYPSLENNKIKDNVLGIVINPGIAAAAYAKKDRITIRNNFIYNNRQCGIFVSSLNKSNLSTLGNTISGSGNGSSRSGGAVIGYPHEALFQALMNSNTLSGNNGRDIQQYKELAETAGVIGSSNGRLPSFFGGKGQ
ncbi:MAG: DUF1565 domain-containing protein, partial [Candidatus Electrothrix sp. AR3]|nr:DUF1565 domain-containing protein [Candidatus Electrothrix sp. AR3]